MTDITPDTSVVVAGLSSWHPDHEAARSALASRPRIIGQVLLESYSVLTRLPPGRRVEPAIVLAALSGTFPDSPIVLPARRMFPLLRRLEAVGISGGATYDAVIAESARSAGLRLTTLDSRARPTYAAVGVEIEWLG
ncbi:MAG: PIN domain-containing protein [Ilumatobacteraceae bacterium]